MNLEKELPQKYVRPGIPCLWPRGHAVDHAQEVEHLEIIDVPELSGELHHELLILDVPLGGCLDHGQMFPHQEGDRVDVVRREAHPREDPSNDLGALLGVVLFRHAFANVVEQGRPEEKLRVGDLLTKLRVEGAALFGLRVGEFLQDPHGQQGMLVHRMHVVFVVLNPVDDRLHLREEGNQDTRIEHLVQDVEGLGRRHENAPQRLDHGIRASVALVDHGQAFPHEAYGIDRKGHAQQGALLEDLDQQERVLPDGLGGFEMQGLLEDPQARNAQAGHDLPSVGLLSPGHHSVQETPMEVLDELHVAVHLPQTPLHGLLSVHVLEPQIPGQLHLMLEVELVALPSCNLVQPVSHLPDERNGLGKALELVAGEMSVVHEFTDLLHTVFAPCDPADRMVIPQTSEALLYVRFQKVGGVSKLGVTRLARLDEPFQQRATTPLEHLVLDPFHEIRIE